MPDLPGDNGSFKDPKYRVMTSDQAPGPVESRTSKSFDPLIKTTITNA